MCAACVVAGNGLERGRESDKGRKWVGIVLLDTIISIGCGVGVSYRAAISLATPREGAKMEEHGNVVS